MKKRSFRKNQVILQINGLFKGYKNTQNNLFNFDFVAQTLQNIRK